MNFEAHARQLYDQLINFAQDDEESIKLIVSKLKIAYERGEASMQSRHTHPDTTGQ